MIRAVRSRLSACSKKQNIASKITKNDASAQYHLCGYGELNQRRNSSPHSGLHRQYTEKENTHEVDVFNSFRTASRALRDLAFCFCRPRHEPLVTWLSQFFTAQKNLSVCACIFRNDVYRCNFIVLSRTLRFECLFLEMTTLSTS